MEEYKRLTHRDKQGKAWANLSTESTREEQMDFGRLSLKRLTEYENLGSVEDIQKRLEKLEELERLIEIGQLRRSCFVYTSHGA